MSKKNFLSDSSHASKTAGRTMAHTNPQNDFYETYVLKV